ncbi:hypothetical protein Tco_1504224 [Tanacetum coccineum]
MTTLADKAILSGADNRPPMLEKDMYDSWKSRMELYMLNRQNGRMILESVESEALQVDCDIKATNIILQGLPPEVNALVSNHKVAQELWERIQLLMQGTSLTKQERECKLYDEFDKFAYKKGESLHEFYLRFSLLLNDMNIYNMKLEQFQVNTKFLNTLPPEWSKFVTDVKLVRDLHTTNIDQLYAYLGQYEFHANELSIHHNIYSPSLSIPQLEYPPSVDQQSEFSQQESGLIVLVFQKGDDPIDAINHMISFLTAVGRQTSIAASTSRTYTPGASENNSGKQRTDKVLLVQAQASSQILHEEELTFFANPGILGGHATQTIITHNVAYQADDLDAYDSDCDELNTAKVPLMANLSQYGSDALSKVHNHDNVNNDMTNQVVQAMPSSEQSNIVNHLETKITSDSNIIPYSQYLIESQQVAVQNSNSFAQQDDLILSVIEHLKTQVVHCTKTNLENKSVNDTLTVELERYKEQFVEIDHLKRTLSEHLKEKESLLQTVTLLKNDFKKEESRNLDREIALEKQFFYDNPTKQALGFQNPFYLKKAQQLEPMLYVGDIIQKTNPIVIPDSEETLTLVEESRLKMLLKHKDNMMQEKIKQIDTTPIDYVALNKLYKDFETRPTNVEVPKELPKVSMVNTILKKLNYHLANFDVCLKLKTELQKDFVEKEIYDKLFKRDNSISNQSAQSQEKDMVIKKLKERIKSLSGNMDKDKIKQDLEEIETINIELDHRVTKLIAENEHLKQTYKQLYDSIKPARVRSKEQCADLTNQVNLKSVEISDLNACLQEKVLVITTLKDELRKLKGKDLANNEVTHHPSDPEINTEPITLKLLNKRSAHSAYIKHTQEEAAVLRDLVDHIKANYPLDPTLESSLAVTPMNKVKRVRFTEPVTSSRNTITKKASTSNLASNKPMLSSTGVKPSTSASGSQPSGNTKKDRILQTQSSTQKNKVEAHPRKVKSSLKNKDHVVAPKGTAHVQHSKLNANSELKYVKPTGRTFTIVGNACPLTRITTTTEAPLRKPVVLDNETSKPAVTLVYSRKPRNSKTNVPVSKSKVLQSVSSNKKKPTRHGLVRGLPKLKFKKDHLCSACAMGKSKKKPHKPKSEDTNHEKLYLLHTDLCGPMHVASVNGKKYTQDFMSDYVWLTEHSSLGPALHEMTPAIISSGLVPNPPPSTLFLPPLRTDWDTLFQPLFNELLNPPPSVDHPAPEVVALINEVAARVPAVSTGSPSSTIVNQDAPSPSNS